ncbi:unnamed protein product [Microthlaspi erraticum]|uniref:F-box domain-containing protein n=1 Tax=Microthlaspi erraticum TaxID=1685480 RepID=A0A6D2KRJ3_9BRAS|nr:unnamed protein product [Microthlaspi erraticum]
MIGSEKSKHTRTKSKELDRISQLPDPLLCNILSHLPTKDAVKTSVCSVRWRSLWLWLPCLELSSENFSDFNAFMSFGDRFFDSNRVSCLNKVKLHIEDDGADLKSWIDATVKRKIQHLHVRCTACTDYEMPSSLYNCETLVSLKLREVNVSLVDVKFVSLPRVKTMHLKYIHYGNGANLEASFERLVSCCPVLEELKIFAYEWMCRSAQVYRVVSRCTFKLICEYSRFELLPQFGYMSRLCVTLPVYYLKSVPTFLESCPKLKSLILVWDCNSEEMRSDDDDDMHNPIINFASVPECLLSSLEFVDIKTCISGHAPEMKVVEYFLENSAILKKITLRLNYYDCANEKSFFKILMAIPRRSATCEVVVL